jgi:uncharacterized C2H2 Zn-finger protein
MALQDCPDCSAKLRDKKHARKHYQKHHSGEIETPEEYLDRIESEQRDFDGGEPTTDGHNPEYLTENESAGDNTRLGTLHEFEREEDSSLEEFEEGDSE